MPDFYENPIKSKYRFYKVDTNKIKNGTKKISSRFLNVPWFNYYLTFYTRLHVQWYIRTRFIVEKVFADGKIYIKRPNN